MTKGPTGNKPGFAAPTAAATSATVQLPQPQAISIDQALVLAAQHQEAGRLPQAEELLKKILQAQPQHAQAWHLLGIVAHMAGNNEMAAELVGRAIKINGNAPTFHANRGEMCRLLERLDEAVAHGKRAVELDPRSVGGNSNLGIAYYDLEKYEEAEACHKAALAINPNFAPSLNNMGSILREREDFEGAMEYYHRAAQANPRYIEPFNNLGAVLTQLDRPAEALSYLDQAIAISPNYAEAHCNRAFALVSLERFQEAMTGFETALKLRADYPEAHQGISRIWKELNDFDKAEAAALKAVEMDPEMPEAHASLGGIYIAQGRSDLAKECFSKALKLDPESPSGKMGLGNILLEEGRFKEAEEMFRAVLSRPGERIGALFSIAQSGKIKAGDDIAAMLEEDAKKIAEMTESKQTYMHFALGKIYDDMGDAERAFPHFMAGCALKRKKLSYDADERDRYFKHVAEIFTPSFIESRRGQGFNSDIPIFVLGMPRSGTTLTEQIIASHPDVFGAGELFDLVNLLHSKGNTKLAAEFPDNMKSINLAETGRAYVAGLRARDAKAKRITDKMPVNFMHIGLIHLALPNAKIVHVNRNPLDTCISCYTRLFAHNQNQTYDMHELGRYYRGYHELMQHWRKVLPKDAFYDVQYETLVDDTEAEARKLIAYCGLEWNDSCLAFHENKRNVRTASVHQVRQPIYKTSVARWKKYEKFIGPLIEGLGDSFIPE